MIADESFELKVETELQLDNRLLITLLARPKGNWPKQIVGSYWGDMEDGWREASFEGCYMAFSTLCSLNHALASHVKRPAKQEIFAAIKSQIETRLLDYWRNTEPSMFFFIGENYKNAHPYLSLLQAQPSKNNRNYDTTNSGPSHG
jgi:hypothetical protein